jgi:putative membrane protein
MNDSFGRDELALERTLLAAERTFSAWIRTGLAALGGGLAVVRALVFHSYVHRVVSYVIGGLLVMWGANIFVYAIISYHRICVKLSQEGLSKNSLGVMILMTAVLLIIAGLVLWIILQ